jgi:hypothetical protein
MSQAAQSPGSYSIRLPALEPLCNLVGIKANGAFDAEAGNGASRRQPVYVLGSHLQHLGQFVHLQRGGPLFDLFKFGHEFPFAVDSSDRPLTVQAFGGFDEGCAVQIDFGRYYSTGVRRKSTFDPSHHSVKSLR